MFEKRDEGYHAVIEVGKFFVENLEYTEEAARKIPGFVEQMGKGGEKKWNRFGGENRIDKIQRCQEENDHDDSERNTDKTENE